MFFKKRKKVFCGNCPHCGALLEQGAHFCVECGKKLEKAAVAYPKEQILYCQSCGRKLKPGTQKCKSCGNTVYVNSFESKNRNCISKNDIDRESGWLNKDFDYGATGLLDEQDGDTGFNPSAPTSLLDDYDDSEATGLLDEPVSNVTAKLIRRTNGENIIIDKDVFKIGKESAKVDYCVVGNRTVSRVHAEIVFRNGSFYIFDNNSLNKTYINGMVLQPQSETMLNDGDVIRLSDVEFEFRH